MKVLKMISGIRFPVLCTLFVVKEPQIIVRLCRNTQARTHTRITKEMYVHTAHNLVQCQFLYYHLPFNHNSKARQRARASTAKVKLFSLLIACSVVVDVVFIVFLVLFFTHEKDFVSRKSIRSTFPFHFP